MKYQKIVNNGIQCNICPRNCTLQNGQTGFCKVRKCVNDEIISTTYGYNTGLSIDPIEKKPLYHFYPGSAVLSFGTLGCNMGCIFCQNHHMTKVDLNPTTLNKTTPEEILLIAKKYNVKSVAFTYNDPIVFFEYAIDTAKLLQQEGIKTIAVTSGFMNFEPATEFYQYMDAANIDLKGFSEEFYSKNCLAKLQPVLDLIKYVKQNTGCHVELTTLLIEGENDSDNMLNRQIDWILETTGDKTPLHFSAFTPKYKLLDKPPTSPQTLFKAYQLAQEKGLKYVYTGNILNVPTSTTYCPHCGNQVIIRNGFQVLNYNIINGNCAFCNNKIDGHYV